MTAADPKTALDLSRAPRGELAAASLVDAVAKVGDLAERHYLELKGPDDLASKVNKQKIAKFILGAANRLTDKAMEAFEGCAVMILGITAKGATGLPPMRCWNWRKLSSRLLASQVRSGMCLGFRWRARAARFSSLWSNRRYQANPFLCVAPTVMD